MDFKTYSKGVFIIDYDKVLLFGAFKECFSNLT